MSKPDRFSRCFVTAFFVTPPLKKVARFGVLNYSNMAYTLDLFNSNTISLQFIYPYHTRVQQIV